MARTALALDLGTNLGWAVCDGGIIAVSGTEYFGKPGDLEGRKYMRFYNWLREFSGIDEIFIENVVPNKNWPISLNVYYGELAIVQMFASSIGVTIESRVPSTVRKHFTGRGTRGSMTAEQWDAKLEVCRAAHKLGWRGGVPGTRKADNEADAIALAHCILSERGHEVIIAC